MRNYIFLILTLFFPIFTQAQTEGLCTVTKVQVGDQAPTPVAKWFDLQANGQLLSGNGGIINTRGNWSQEGEQLFFHDEQGQADPAGPFQIQKAENTMTWTREEEGMSVSVFLETSTSLPKATWDHLYGNWQIREIWQGDQNQTNRLDPDQKMALFFRWDHQYTARNTPEIDLTASGIWQIHGHRDELRLWPFDSAIEGFTWKIEKIDNQQLILSREAEGGAGESVGLWAVGLFTRASPAKSGRLAGFTLSASTNTIPAHCT